MSNSKVTVDRRLWLTADEGSLVEDGDTRAAFLWATEGREVSQEEADRVGYKPKAKKAAKATKKSASSSEDES